MPSVAREVESVEEVAAGLRGQNYLIDPGLATSLFLALRLRRPLLLEGEAGVGKTELAKAVSAWAGAPLIRLQCHEGIDLSQALYEWDHSRQLLHLRTAEATGTAGSDAARLEAELYGPEFLIRRPLLAAIDHGEAVAPVLLIDEVDRADDEFEAFLLEALSEYAVTIPEIGEIRAADPPIVIVTSNRTRDVHDALKRRCLYHWVDHPDFEREVAIIGLRTPGVGVELARQVATVTGELREAGLYKPPGIAETLDWAQALGLVGAEQLDAETVDRTLGALLKYREDQDRVRGSLLEEAVERALAAS